jgi:CBS domain-containing protein
MATHDIKKLPVVEDFDLVGIVTLTDVARHQPKQVEEIRQEIESRDEWT